ncbi:hypothetical protein C5C95_03400 [Rathayibacter sp. AY1B7]|uniref:tetratricopeptide repeat protein n=1 Tax=Rathayibacter sp. AY1B7 TaxID=2080532 RepID=UPI000CE72132|nr:tetratricopeptide repeat protein [Rathayibacter sp. AY1B7]PPI01195.1 hypothetical protein C5C95_03400 [Rathayibacter sp. AY1B7]
MASILMQADEQTTVRGLMTEPPPLRSWAADVIARARSAERSGRTVDALRLYETVSHALHGAAEIAASCDVDLGIAAQKVGRFDAAAEAFDRARRYYSAKERPRQLAEVDANLAAVEADRGRLSAAIDGYERARETFVTLADAHGTARCEVTLADLYRRSGQLAQASASVERATEHLRDGGDPFLIGMCSIVAARIRLNQGRTDESRKQLAEAAAYARSAPELVGVLKQATGELDLAEGRVQAAVSAFKKARVAFVDADDALGVARCDVDLGLAYLARDDWARAHHFLGQAALFYQRAGQFSDLAYCDANVGLAYERQAAAETDPSRHELLTAAAAALVPAALFLDARRFEIADADQRAEWTGEIAGAALDGSYRVAYALGEGTLLAELILDDRSVGAMGEGPCDQPGVAFSEGAAAASVVGLLGGDRRPLGPSPFTTLAEPTVAMASWVGVAESRYHAVLRARSVVHLVEPDAAGGF